MRGKCDISRVCYETQHDRNDSRDLNELVNSPPAGLIPEFWLFLRTNKKCWRLPLLFALLLLGLLVVVLGGTTLFPFIYPFL